MPHNEPLDAPERRCILTGAHGTRDGLIRLALGPDGEVLPDLGAKAPGRGAWVSPDRALIATALAKGKLRGALLRAFKGQTVQLPDDLVARIDTGLARRALDRLGLELRSGHLILGHDRILEYVMAGRVALLLHAADAAGDGTRRLDAKLRNSGSDGRSIHLPLPRAELSVALGRENVVHAAVSDEAASARVAAAVDRWRAFSGTIDGDADPGPVPAGEDVRI